MGNPTRKDGRIEPGQKLGTAISARAWNRAQDAADIVLGDRTRFAAATTAVEKASNIVLVRNATTLDVPQFGVLGIFGSVVDPGANAERIALNGVIPVLEQHRHRFVVTLEPIAAGAVGRAAAGGVFYCKVVMASESHRFATVKDGDRTALQSTECGPARLLWVKSGTGARWAAGTM